MSAIKVKKNLIIKQTHNVQQRNSYLERHIPTRQPHMHRTATLYSREYFYIKPGETNEMNTYAAC